ncbi:MAG: hypothetical protein ACRDY7_08485 [Acidimicrobiia bacterium]
MGPIALFVVLMVLPVLAIVLVALAVLAEAVIRALAAVPGPSWAGLAGGMLLGAAILHVRHVRRRRRLHNETYVTSQHLP